MSLSPGTRLGAYEVVAALGAGGMGEVYRARDTRLDRDVAIKVLPPHLSADETARARFEREAKAIAALSHPNILAIYDVGLHEGAAFVVMELLEGETLRERLNATGGPTALPARKAIQIGIEVAQGLAAAHDKQIVHRDLKPENIFIAADGRVKILDFGLARQGGRSTDSSTDAATVLQHTDPGTVMGTAGYMAPEQVKALPVDHRADIFALGCVLYEMASGARPFARDTVAETMSAILRDDPPDLPGDSAPRPASFDHVVRHCLEKRPEERFQSARDLAFALQSIGFSSTPSGPRPPGADTYAPAAPRRRWASIAVLVAVALAGASFFAGRFTSRPADAGATLHIATFQQVTDSPGVETAPTLSPDGKTVVYGSDASGKLQLYSLRVGSRSPSAITTGPVDRTPAFSPEGDRIAFRSERDGGGIFLMTATGESVTRLSAEGFSPSWSPDGTEVVVARGTFISPMDVASSVPGLVAIDVKTARKREVLKIGTTLQPSWSPHGHRIAYFGLRTNTGQRDIFTVAADGSAADNGAIEVTNDAPLDWNPVWSPDGDYLYFSSNRGGTMNLWRIPIDEKTGRVGGDPEPVTTPSSWSGMMSFSRDGRSMAFASLDWRSTLLRQNLDPVRGVTIGLPAPVLKGSRPIRDHSISPDGQWVAFNETGTREDLFVARTNGSDYRRLTDDAARDRGPVWAPDSTRLFFYSDRGGMYDLWSIRPDGGPLEQITKGSSANFPVVSPDGTRVAFGGVSAAGMVIVDANAKAAPPPAPEPSIGLGQSFWPYSWSAVRGQLLGLIVTTQGETDGLATYDINARKYRLIAGAEDRSYGIALWLNDGRRFLFRATSGIRLVDSETGVMKTLTSVRGYLVGRSLSIASDNSWYSYTETGTEGDIWVATFADSRQKRQ